VTARGLAALALALSVAVPAAAQPEAPGGSSGDAPDARAEDAAAGDGPAAEPTDGAGGRDNDAPAPASDAPAPASDAPATASEDPATDGAASSASPSSARPAGGATRPARSPAGASGAAPAAQPTYVVMANRGDDDEEEEEEAEDEDPYDILWIELFGGLSYVDMRAIDTENYYPEFVELSGTGPAGGLAVGFRVEFLSVGLRGALAHYGDGFEVGTAVAEVALALPIPVVKPYVRAGFGFGWHGDSNVEDQVMVPTNAQTTVFGWAFNAAAGVDVYLADWFAIGAAFNVDILNMSRQSFDEPAGDPGDVVFEDTGDAVGLQARGQLGVSFHL
jgi:hypothetical protein